MGCVEHSLIINLTNQWVIEPSCATLKTHETCQVGAWVLSSWVSHHPALLHWSLLQAFGMMDSKNGSDTRCLWGKGISSFIVVCFKYKGLTLYSPCWLGTYCIAHTGQSQTHSNPPASASWGLELQVWATMPVLNEFGLHVYLMR